MGHRAIAGSNPAGPISAASNAEGSDSAGPLLLYLRRVLQSP